MEHAWIAGKPAALDTAIAEAAKLLASSPHPFIAGLGTDVTGARAAIAPAERVGAVIDHLHADALLRNLDVIRSSGVLLRADTLLLVDTGLRGRFEMASEPCSSSTRFCESDTYPISAIHHRRSHRPYPRS